MNNLEAFSDVFAGLKPYRGVSDPAFLVDFLGVKTSTTFREMWNEAPVEGGRPIEVKPPPVSCGEGWFEAVNWVEAAREAKDHYVMITLGACYGAQAVGAYKALQAINPMPAKLVCVEGDPDNVAWIEQHFRDNGLDPEEHWVLEAALGADHEPILYPIHAAGTGAQNCYSTNLPEGRMDVARSVAQQGKLDSLITNLMLNNSTGMQIQLAPGSGYDFSAELKFVSATTLADVLGPFDRVDYVESDIQQSETIVFPPAIDALTRKVRRCHLGTHGAEVHDQMRDLFAGAGWDIVFDYSPNSRFETPYGSFETNDGVLTAVNPRLAPK